MSNNRPIILFIDDDKDVLNSYSLLLERKYPNCDIESFDNAADALSFRDELKRENKDVSVYITDSRMPDITGIEFLKKVKDDSAGRIMLTAYSDLEVAIEGINTKSIDFYIEKGENDKEKLFRSIDNILHTPKTKFSDLVVSTPKDLLEDNTPYFMFDLDVIKDNLSAIRNHLKPDKILYAIKCNSLEKVVETIYNQGAGFEINTIGEYEKVRKFVCPNDKVDTQSIVNSHPLCDPKDVKFFYDLGMKQFCFDGKSQIDNLAINAPGSDAYLRIYNDNTGSRFKLNRLGAKIKDTQDLINYALENGINVNGITFHVGSQCSVAENYDDAIRESAELFTNNESLKILNIGGGFPTEYKRAVPSIKEISSTINDSIDKHFDQRPIVYVEPGRFVVGNSAYTSANVTHIDEKQELSRVSIDMSVFSGLIELLEIKEDGFAYPIITNSDGESKRYQIVGTTCAGTDIIASEVILPELKVDHKNPKNSSKLFFLNTGAYTLDYIGNKDNFGFNGARIPKAYFLEDGELVDTDAIKQDMTIKIIKSPEDKLWKKCERVEYDVFESESYIESNPEKRISDFDKYQRTEFVSAIEDNKLIGVMRLVYNNAKDLKFEHFPTLDHANVLDYTQKDAENNKNLKPPFEDGKTLWLYSDTANNLTNVRSDNTLDLSTMAITKAKRDSQASKRIITNIMYRTWSQGLKYALGAIDTPFYQKLKETGLPFEDLGPSVDYWGSQTTPTIIDSHQILSGFQKLFIPYKRILGIAEKYFS